MQWPRRVNIVIGLLLLKALTDKKNRITIPQWNKKNHEANGSEYLRKIQHF